MGHIIKNSPGIKAELFGLGGMGLGLSLAMIHDTISGIGFLGAGLVISLMGYISVLLGK